MYYGLEESKGGEEEREKRTYSDAKCIVERTISRCLKSKTIDFNIIHTELTDA
jgi:hypothetical protein